MNYIKTVLPVLILLLIPFSQIDGAETKKIVGSDEDSEIIIEFRDDQLIGYSINVNDVLLEPVDPKFKIKDDRFLLIDRANGLFIIGKNLNDEKYLVISKIKLDSQDTAKRYVMTIEEPREIIGQRDLLSEMNQRDAVTENSKAVDSDTLNKINQAKKIHDEELERLESANSNVSDTDANYSQYEEYKKSIYDRDDNRPEAAISIEEQGDIALKLFPYVPRTIQLKESLNYNVLATDADKGKYESNYGSVIGNPISNVTIKSMIKDPLGAIMHESNGTTNNDGLYEDSFVIPENSVTNGPWVVKISGAKSINGTTVEQSAEKEFYVNVVSGINNPPVAVISSTEKILTMEESFIHSDSTFKIKETSPPPFVKDDIGNVSIEIVTANQTDIIRDYTKVILGIDLSKINATHFKSNNMNDIFYIALKNQTEDVECRISDNPCNEFSKDPKYNELEMSLIRYGNTANFKNYDGELYMKNVTSDSMEGKKDIVDSDNIRTLYIGAGDYDDSNDVSHEQLKFLLKNQKNDQKIVEQDGENLIWNLNQAVRIELDGSKSFDEDDLYERLEFVWEYFRNDGKFVEQLLMKDKQNYLLNNAMIEKMFNFKLTVNDQRKYSIPVWMNVTVYNGTICDSSATCMMIKELSNP